MDPITSEIAALVKSCKSDHAVQLLTVERKIDDLTKALTGDTLHSNGLVTKVAKLDMDVRNLQFQISEFRSGLRGMAIGIGLGAGIVGGGLATGLAKILGG